MGKPQKDCPLVRYEGCNIQRTILFERQCSPDPQHLKTMALKHAERSDPRSNDEDTSERVSTRLQRKTAVELVVEELRSRILSGSIAPGLPLRQEALAEELGVSRIPLREAIRLLSTEGLLDLVPHRGAFVSMISLAEVREFFEIRLKLEPWLLHEAVPNLTEQDLQRASATVAEMDEAEAAQWGALNWRLHERLYAPAGRPLTLNMVRALHEKSERYFRFQVMNAPIRQQAHDEHMQLIELCRQRKADMATVALEDHISQASAQIVEIVGRLLTEGEPATAAS